MTSALAVMAQSDHCCHPPPQCPIQLDQAAKFVTSCARQRQFGGVKRSLTVQDLQVSRRSSLVAESEQRIVDSRGPLEPNVSAWSDHCRYGGECLELAVGSTKRAA
jgi:hypothetical protein